MRSLGVILILLLALAGCHITPGEQRYRGLDEQEARQRKTQDDLRRTRQTLRQVTRASRPH